MKKVVLFRFVFSVVNIVNPKWRNRVIQKAIYAIENLIRFRRKSIYNKIYCLFDLTIIVPVHVGIDDVSGK